MPITTNTTDSEGGAQYYSSSPGALNETLKEIFSFQDIVVFNNTGEGVFSGILGDGTTSGFMTSRNIIKTIDLLAEGEIEGLVSGEFVPDDDGVAGQIGWTGGYIEPYSDHNPEAFLRSIYLNDTPVVNVNNQYNFQKVEVALTNGVPSGVVSGDNFLAISDESPVEKTRIINERLRGPDMEGAEDNPFYYHSKVYRFLNPHIDKVRVNIKIPSLSFLKLGDDWEDDELGEMVGTHISFRYRYRPVYDGLADSNWYGKGGAGGPGAPLKSKVTGIIRSAFLHKRVIDLDPVLINDKLIGWEIEITRITLDAIESHVNNQSFVDSITEITDTTLSYPNSAVASMAFDAEHFSQVPNRSFDLRLLKVKVPTGYDPMLKRYCHGDLSQPGDCLKPWDGTFQGEEAGTEKKWTDNPAWIFYDLLTNQRYGLGKQLGDIEIDRWTLYEISKFCDVLVEDGQGGLEPRFTCNVLINTREDAFKVLQDLASTFRSIVYYGYGNVHAVMDKPRSEIAQYNNANVLDGNFSYSSTSQKIIPTVAIVRYNDKENFYKPNIEYIENTEAIRKYGVIEKEITAFGCTSRGQAIRLGRWLLSTELAQREVVTFTAGPEAMMIRPGDIVRVTDTNRSTGLYGGRVVDIGHDHILLDRHVGLSEEDTTNYLLSVTTPSYFYDESIVSGIGQEHYEDFRRSHVQDVTFSPSNENITIEYVDLGTEASGTKIISSTSMFSSVTGQLLQETAWNMGDINTKNNNLYSILSSKENENYSYAVEALVHDVDKYGFIESGIFYSYIPTPDGATKAPPPPASVSVVVEDYPNSHSTKRIKIKPIKPTDKGTTIGYKIYVKNGPSDGSGGWIADDMKNTTSSIPKDIYLEKVIFLSDLVDADTNPYSYYVPPLNDKYYYTRVFAINSAGVLSSNSEDGTPRLVNNHFPVKDIKIHSLRLHSDFVISNPVESEPTKETYPTSDDRDTRVMWIADFLNEATINIPISYRVSIHEPNTNSNIALEELADYTTDASTFTFNFERNQSMVTGSNPVVKVGPKRHFDVVVQAVDDNGVTSSGVYGGQEFGWDIIEVVNPKPSQYHLTPRAHDGTTEGNQTSCDNMWTSQYIDSDGFLHLKLLSNKFSDIAGGYAYISKHPFSGADFNTDGSPKLPKDRANLVFTEEEKFKSGEYVITETHFEEQGIQVYGAYNSEIVVKPNMATGSFSPPYYIAAKFYDSFDREVRKDGLNGNWNVGLLGPNPSDANVTDGLWLGFGRDNKDSNGNVLMENYCLTSGSCGLYIGNYDDGEPDCDPPAYQSATFSVPIWPTKYYSANQGGFKYWARINVNGQWEGQGISHIKVLTAADVLDLYDYKGYYEFACVGSEKRTQEYYDYYGNPQLGPCPDGVDCDDGHQHIHYGPYDVYWPNHPDSIMRCRFRQAKVNRNNFGLVYNVDKTTVKYGGTTLYSPDPPMFMTTGATRNFIGTTYLPLELTRAGYAYEYGTPGADYTFDEIPSYNERGKALADKTRPLRGMRRFRVYFDPINLPQASEPDGLASYSVIGMNAWNGPYESWPGSLNSAALEESLLFAKDGSNVFPVSAQSWLASGDLFENIPGAWNHHPAGFGQGFGGMIKTQKYFDVHMGRQIDDSYLNEAFFGVVTTNDYSIQKKLVMVPAEFDQATELHEAVYNTAKYVSLPPPEGDGNPYPED